MPAQKRPRFGSFQTSNAQREDGVAPVAVDEVGDEVADEIRPPVEVARRRDDPAIREHGRVGVRGEVARHERELDDRPKTRVEHPVEDVVDLGEVVDRSAAGVAVDAERVVEDGVRPNGLDAELVVDDAECLGQL